ncbi:MAG: hypothetical protein ACE5HA_05875 [Anaerolineae bacterium]
MQQIEGSLFEEQAGQVQPERRKPYARPRIIHELELETRAGSPLGIDPLDPLDPFNLLDRDANE